MLHYSLLLMPLSCTQLSDPWKEHGLEPWKVPAKRKFWIHIETRDNETRFVLASCILSPRLVSFSNLIDAEIAHFNHKNRSVVAGVPQKVLTMRIISGQQLPKPEKGSATGEIIDPYVEIQVVGVPIDCAEFKTKVIKDNG